MPETFVQVEGLEELMATLDDLETVQKNRIMISTMREVQRFFLEEVQTYPQPPPASTYERTFAFQASWQVTPPTISGPDLLGPIVSNYPAAHWIMNEPTQARIHQGRWDTVQAIGEVGDELALMLLDEAVQKIIRQGERRG